MNFDFEIEYFKYQAYSTLKQWNIKEIPTIKISNRLGNNTKGKCKIFLNDKTAIITLNGKYIKKEGLVNSKPTFFHELSHYINYKINGNTGHDRNFLKINNKLGGSVNHIQKCNSIKLGLNNFTEASFDIPKYTYTCSCGKCIIHKNKKMDKRIKFKYECAYCKDLFADFSMKINN